MGSLPKRAAIALLLAFCAVSPGARADAIRVWEIAIPDLRYEFQGSFTDGKLAIGLPIPFAPWVFGLGSRRETIPGGIPGSTTSISRPEVVLVPELLAEPQYRFSGGHARVVLGARLFAIHGLSRFHLAAEGLFVAGEDGTGGGFGLGVGWASIVSLAYRRLWTDEASRHALMFDVRLAVFPWSQPQKTLRKLGPYRGPLPP